MEYRYAVNESTGEFVYGGPEPYDCVPGLSPGQIRVVLPRAPDVLTERYSGNPSDPFRRASAAEITEAQAFADGQKSARLYTNDAKATVAWVLFRLLGRDPTGAEKQSAGTEWKTILRRLD